MNNSQIGNTASEPSISNSDTEASISQLISTDIMSTSQPPMDHNMPNIIRSQPLLISDQSRVEILMRQRTARRRRAQRRWQQRVQHQHQQLAHQIRYRQMVNQHFQQQRDHQHNQDEELQQEEQQDPDRHNHTLSRSPTFYDLFAEVMNERLLEIYDWEALTPENQPEQEQLTELESTAAMEHPVLVQDDANQSPEIHASESSEEGEQQKNTQMAEECNHTPLSIIGANSTLNSFDSVLFEIEPMEEQQGTDPSRETSQQYETTKEHGSNGKENTDN